VSGRQVIRRIAVFGNGSLSLGLLLSDGSEDGQAQVPRFPAPQLQRVRDYIHAHLSSDLGLTTLAGEVQLKPYHVAHLFKNTVGHAAASLCDL